MTQQNKTIFGSLVILGIIILAYVLGCNRGVKSVVKTTHTDTVVKTVEVASHELPKVVDSAKPRIEYKDRWHDGEVVHEPGEPYPVYVDTSGPYPVDEMTEYNTHYFLLDTSVKGLRISDTLFQNSIVGRGINLRRSDTVITKETILYPPKRTVGYFTLGGLGNKSYLGGSVGLGLKNRSDVVYQVNYTWINGIGKPFYGGTLFVPIHLIKHKK